MAACKMSKLDYKALLVDIKACEHVYLSVGIRSLCLL